MIEMDTNVVSGLLFTFPEPRVVKLVAVKRKGITRPQD